MEQRIFHGNITPGDVTNQLRATFNRGNYRVQAIEGDDFTAIQIATVTGIRSGGSTAITIQVRPLEDGVMIQIGEQSWLGIAASMGTTAASVLFHPVRILERLDDIAQDIESIQLTDQIWNVIEETAKAAGASHSLSERLSRITCSYCGTANPVGEGNCLACGAPLGEEQPETCPNCGYVVTHQEKTCPNCGKALPLLTRK